MRGAKMHIAARPFLRSWPRLRSVRSLRSFVAPLVGHRRRCARGGSGRSVLLVARSSVLACARGGSGRSVLLVVRGAVLRLIRPGSYVARPPCAPRPSLPRRSLPSSALRARLRSSSLTASSLPPFLRLACSRRRRPPPPLLSRSVRSLRYAAAIRSETALRQAHFRAPHRIVSKC